MLVGAGAGVVLNIPSGAGASSGATTAVTAGSTGDTTDPSADSTNTIPADSPAGLPGKEGRGAFLKTQLDALVVDGTITQVQEDAILSGIESARPATGAGDSDGDHAGRGPGMDGRGDHGGPGMGGRGHGFGLGGGIDAAATALGVTKDELKTELGAGKTIADIATAKGVVVQTVIDAIVAAETTELTQRVTDAVNGVKPTPPADAPDPSTDSGNATPTTTG